MEDYSFPLISIIVPIYNSEKFLRRCITSLENQTYSNIEIILIDDGSQDNSLSICEEYATLNPKIRVFHISNGGVSLARNTGLEKSNGDFITFFDSDDYVHPQYIEIMYKAISDSHSDIAQCKSKYVSGKISKYKYYSIDNIEYKNITGKEAAFRCVYGNELLYFCSVWDKLFSRNVINNIVFPNFYNAEDSYFSYKSFFNSSNVALVDLPLYFYFKHAGSATTSNIDLSSNIISVFDEFDNICRVHIDNDGLLEEYLKHSHLLKMDAIAEDYWNAFRFDDSKRKKEMIELYDKYKIVAELNGYDRKFKLRLFEKNPFIFLMCRFAYKLIFST